MVSIHSPAGGPLHRDAGLPFIGPQEPTESEIR